MDELPFSVANSHLDPFEPMGYTDAQLFTCPSTSEVSTQKLQTPQHPGSRSDQGGLKRRSNMYMNILMHYLGE